MTDDAALVRAIGLLTINFAFLELAADWLLMGFVSADDRAAQIAVADSTLVWVLEKLSAFVDIVIEDQGAKDVVSAWISEATGVRTERNKYVHSALAKPVVAGDLSSMVSFTIRGKNRVDPTVSLIHADAATIEDLAKRTRAIAWRGMSEISPLLARTPAAHWHSDYRDE